MNIKNIIDTIPDYTGDYNQVIAGLKNYQIYVSKIDEAHILAINPRNEISGESEFADLELIVATKHPEDPEVYVALVVPIESLKTISDTIVDDFGFSEMLGGYEKLYMVEQDFFEEEDENYSHSEIDRERKAAIASQLAQRGLLSIEYSNQATQKIDLEQDINYLFDVFNELAPEESATDQKLCRKAVEKINLKYLKSLGDLKPGDRIEAELFGKLEFEEDGSIKFTNSEVIKSKIRGNFTLITDVCEFDEIDSAKKYSIGLHIENSGIVIANEGETKSKNMQEFTIPLDYCKNIHKLVQVSNTSQ